jgi:hypothetical protein
MKSVQAGGPVNVVEFRFSKYKRILRPAGRCFVVVLDFAMHDYRALRVKLRKINTIFRGEILMLGH